MSSDFITRASIATSSMQFTLARFTGMCGEEFLCTAQSIIDFSLVISFLYRPLYRIKTQCSNRLSLRLCSSNLAKVMAKIFNYPMINELPTDIKDTITGSSA